MKKIILLAGAAGLFLVSAAVPNSGAREGELSSVVAAEAPGVAARPGAVVKRVPAAKPAPRVADADAGYPRCSATVRDRCVQGRGHGGGSYARVPQRRIQLASRAGERG